jgi:nitrogen-specific signal transduction histidine kinase
VVLDERANVSRLIGVDMDVTERMAAAAALEQVSKDQMRFKDEFLSHVSHELRSPLTAIKQFSTIILNGWAGELNAEQLGYQHIVLKNISQLQSMIDDLLEVTGLETGKLTVDLETVSVSDAVADTINTLQGNARAKGVTLSFDLAPDLPSAYADQTRLRQILIILVDNAIKFTPAGGSARLRARLLEHDPRLLLVEVADTGCGIDPEIGERVFERLYQVSERIHASRKGLGLGLYICKELVTRQGGTIRVESRPQKGCTFSFTLPVFSLDNVIAPLLHNGRWPGESIALVTVEVSFLDPGPSKEFQEEWSRDARNLLQRCLLPDLDVLLPKMGSGAMGERFSVAAFADDKGASVLANRIREQFDRMPHLKDEGLSLSVSYNMLEPCPRDAGASVDRIVSSMARHLEEAIKPQTISAVS